MNATDDPFNPERYYDAVHGDLVRLQGQVEEGLTSAMHSANIKLHSVSARVKERDSYLDKIKRKSYDDPETQIEDLVGARAVCLFTSDLGAMRDAISAYFEIVSEDDKIAAAASDTFGYMSIHYICRLKPEVFGTRYSHLAKLKFEVQCRTILMDAWANVSHYLAYKGEASIPMELRRDFNALAGLFYVADKHFEIFFQSSVQSDEATKELYKETAGSSRTPPLQWPVDRPTMAAYLEARFPDRQRSDAETVSELVEEIAKAGVTSIDAVEGLVERGLAAAEVYEKVHPPSEDPESDSDPTPWNLVGKFTDVGIVRVALAIALPESQAWRYRFGGLGKEYRPLD